jgi:plastocyanin domain-containing protein
MPRTMLAWTISALLSSAHSAVWVPTSSAQAHEHPTQREIEIVVEGAYKPQRIEIRAGERVRLRFVRKDYGPCTREVVFPKLNLRRELPTSQPITIELPALAAGEYEFKCGMNMIKGLLVVK